MSHIIHPSTVSIQQPGLVPALPNDVTKFLNGLGAFSVPSGGGSGNTISSTNYGSEPVSPTTGDADLYINAPLVGRYTGSVWDPFGPLFKFTKPPAAASFTGVNPGSSTLTDSHGGLLLTGAGTGNSSNFQVYVETATLTAPWSRIGFILPTMLHKSFQGYGVCYRQSSDGKLAILELGAADDGTTVLSLLSATLNSATSSGSAYVTYKYSQFINWFKIEDDNTNRKLSISANGLDWLLIHSVARTNFLTADQVGFFVLTQNAVTPNFAPILHIPSWG